MNREEVASEWAFLKRKSPAFREFYVQFMNPFWDEPTDEDLKEMEADGSLRVLSWALS